MTLIAINSLPGKAVTPSVRAARSPVRLSAARRLQGRVLTGAGLALLPWLGYLAGTLPPVEAVAWVALDALEAAGLLTPAPARARRRPSPRPRGRRGPPPPHRRLHRYRDRSPRRGTRRRPDHGRRRGTPPGGPVRPPRIAADASRLGRLPRGWANASVKSSRAPCGPQRGGAGRRLPEAFPEAFPLAPSRRHGDQPPPREPPRHPSATRTPTTAPPASPVGDPNPPQPRPRRRTQKRRSGPENPSPTGA